MGLVVRFRTHLLFIPRVALTALALGSAGCAPKFNFNSSIGLQQSSPAASCAQTSATAVGSGTSGDPYQITCPAQIVDLASNSADWAADYQLESDIDMSGVTISQPIGNDTTYFTGVFDGNGYTISNFTLNDSTDDLVGLFGLNIGLLENLTLSNANVTSNGADTGTLAGLAQQVSNCHATGSVTDVAEGIDGGLVGVSLGATGSSADVSVDSTGIVGGLVGQISGSVVDCFALGNVSGPVSGGLLGDLNGGIVENSYARGSVSDDGIGGGLVGETFNDSTIMNSYATGAVTGSGTGDYGGLVGISYDRDVTITRSYASGAVSGTGEVGGLVGDSTSDVFTGDSYWNNEVNSSINGIGNTSNANVIGASSTVMQSQSSGAYSGWDFSATWEMPTGGVNQGYPVLQWSGDQ